MNKIMDYLKFDYFNNLQQSIDDCKDKFLNT